MVEDALYATGPHLQLLQELDMRFVINAKPGNLGTLFDFIKTIKLEAHSYKDRYGVLHEYGFINDVPLNGTHDNITVNFVDYWQTDKKGKRQHFSWITDIHAKKETVEYVMKAGRSRWHIENETFNTLKNQGYNFEHNYGHGKNNLCTVMSMLMMIAFAVDQITESCHFLFTKARISAGARKVLWAEMAFVFRYFTITDWEHFFNIIIKNGKTLDTV